MAVSRHGPVARESEKVKGLARLVLSRPVARLLPWSPKVEQPRLVRVQSQTEPLRAFRKDRKHSAHIMLVLEDQGRTLALKFFLRESSSFIVCLFCAKFPTRI